jgi:hypothetical protein
MTIKKTLTKLKALGCKARWSSEWQEYRVTLPNLTPKREEAIAYYTSDPFDAVLTGAEMVRTALAEKLETCPKAQAQERIGNIWDAQDAQEAY